MCIVTMKTMTNAQRALRVLSASGIEVEIVSLDRNMTKYGCAYGVSFPCYLQGDTEKILRRYSISYGEVIGGGT